MTTKQVALPWLELNIVETQLMTEMLSPLEKGIYLSLFMRCGQAGYLPNDMRVLRVVCGTTKKQDKNVQTVLDQCFTLVDEQDIYVSEVVKRCYKTAKRDLPMPKSRYNSKALLPTLHNSTVQDITLHNTTNITEPTEHNQQDIQDQQERRITSAELIARRIW